MAGKEITLKVNIDPSGAVSGAQAVKGVATSIVSKFNDVNKKLSELHDAYGKGRAAVDALNIAHVAAKTRLDLVAQGLFLSKQAVLDLVTANAKWLATIKADEAALRAQESALKSKEAAERSAAAAAANHAEKLSAGVVDLRRMVAAQAEGKDAVARLTRELAIEQQVFAGMAGATDKAVAALARDAAEHYDLTAAINAKNSAEQKAIATMERAHGEALQQEAAMQKQQQTVTAYIASLQSEVSRLAGLATAYSNGRSAVDAFTVAEEIKTRQQRLGVAATSAEGQAIAAFTTQEYAARDAAKAAEKAFKDQGKTTDNLKPPTDRATRGLTAFQTAMTTLGSLVLNKFKSEIVGAQQAFDRMSNTFSISSRSSSEAADKMLFLRETANKLGLEIQTTGVAFAKFDVAAQGSSLSASEIRKVFLSVSEATTAMGLSSEVADGALLALQQMISKGTVQSEELRGQFAERIPGAFRLAAEAMGWTQGELAKNLEMGRVMSDEMLPKLADRLHETFGPASVSGSKLLSAEINRLKNEWFDFLVETSQEIRLPKIIKLLSDNFGLLATAVQIFIAAGLITFLPVLVAKFKTLIATLEAAKLAADRFYLSMLGKSAGLVAVILLVITAVIKAREAINDFKEEADLSMAKMIEDGKKLNSEFRELQGIFRELKNAAEGGFTPDLEAESVKVMRDKLDADETELKRRRARLDELNERIRKLSTSTSVESYIPAEKARAEYAALLGTTNQLEYSVGKLKTSYEQANDALETNANKSKRVIQAEKDLAEAKAEAWKDLQNGEFKEFGNWDKQLEEYQRQLDLAYKARNEASRPGFAQQEKRELAAAGKAAREYASEVERVKKKYDDARWAQDDYNKAMALAEELHKKGEFGAYGSAKALEHLNEIRQNGLAMVAEKETPGITALNEEYNKLSREMDVNTAASQAMTAAYAQGTEAVEKQTRINAIAAMTEELLAKAAKDNLKIGPAREAALKAQATAAYDAARGVDALASAAGRTKELENNTHLTEKYIEALKAGPEAVRLFAAYEQAFNEVMADGTILAGDKAKAIADLTKEYVDLFNKQRSASALEMHKELMRDVKLLNEEADAVAGGAAAWERYAIEKQIAADIDAKKLNPDNAGEVDARRRDLYYQRSQEIARDYKLAMSKAGTEFQTDLQTGFSNVISEFAVEFLETGKFSVAEFGNSMLAVVMDALQKWLAQILINQIIEFRQRVALNAAANAQDAAGRAAAAAAGNAANAATGVGAAAAVPAAGGGGGFSSFFAGLSGAAIGLMAFAAIAIAAVAIMKHQVDTANGQRYQTTVSYQADSGTNMSGKLQKTGEKIEKAFADLVNSVQDATGALLVGTANASIAIQNNKKEFQARVNGVLLGTFRTAEEAVVAAIKKLFSSENLQNQLDPIVQQVINNFDAKKGAQAFVDAVKAVSEIMNEVSGLTDIEIQLRDLPAKAAQLTAKLHELGVSMADAGVVAAKWTALQFQSIRNQITGHQMTEAEQRAEKERQAAYFNSQLALNKANMALMALELEQKIAYFKARVSIGVATVNFGKWRVDAELELANQSADIATAELDTRRAANEATIAMLEATREALNLARIEIDKIKPIDFGEIQIDGGGGNGGGGSGQSEAAQRAQAFNDFMAQMAREGMTELEGQLFDLNAAFDEHLQAARELGKVEELEAARLAALARLHEELIDSLGTSLEGISDRFAELREKLEYFATTQRRLLDATKQGGEAGEQARAEWERNQAVLQQFFDMLRSELMGLALYFTDAMGDTAESARIRAELAEMEWDLKRAEFALTLEQLRMVGAISAEEYKRWKRFFDLLPEDRPPAPDGENESPLSWFEEIIDGLGTPLEAVRDRIVEYNKKMAGLSNAHIDLAEQLENGEITADQYNDALARIERTHAELADMAEQDILTQMKWFSDQMGDSKMSRQLAQELAQLEWDLKVAEFEMTLNNYYILGQISEELYGRGLALLDIIRDYKVPMDNGGGGSDTNQENPLEDLLQQLLQALDRLRAIMETYTDFLMNLQTSELSPFSVEQQYNNAQAEYERLLALAQAGDLNAMEALPAAAQAYLELASQMFGTASAGYSQIFAGINADMTEIMGTIQDILNQVPDQFQPIEQRLDTIAEILDNMYLLWMNFDTGTGGGGGGGWEWDPDSTNNPRTLQEVFEAFNLDWSQFNVGELTDMRYLIENILEDSQISAAEMTNFVALMESWLGMSPGSMTPAQIQALRTWMFQQIGNNNGAQNPNAPNSPTAASNTAANNGGQFADNSDEMNKNLQIIANLTAKAVRESATDRQRRPRLTYAGYANSRYTPGRSA